MGSLGMIVLFVRDDDVMNENVSLQDSCMSPPWAGERFLRAGGDAFGSKGCLSVCRLQKINM